MRQCQTYWETTKDTLIETMRFMLDLPPVQTRQKVEQVKLYCTSVPSKNPHKPTPRSRQRHNGIADWDGASLWMGQAEDSILHVCQLTELKQNQGAGTVPKLIPGLFEDTPDRRRGKELLRTASRQNSQRSSFSFKKTADRKTS